jgi:hypothetical protein
MERGGLHPLQDDDALTAMVHLHGLAMSGGLLDAVEGSSEVELAQFVAAYRYFGLDDAADVVEWVAQQVSLLDPQSLEGEEELERQADRRYGDVVPDDSALVHRFERKYQEQPQAFTPVE